MDQEFISRREYEEHSRRTEDEHTRINHRLSDAEKGLEETHKLLVAVEKLALNIEGMQKELQEQGRHLEAMEARDGESWRKFIWYVFTALVGGVVGFLLNTLGV